MGAVAGANDTLSGSLTIQVGGGTAQTITLDSSNNTLAGLMGAINGLSGVSAALNQAGTGLTLTSGSNGAAGALTVTSNIVDATSPATTALNYNASSDINSLTTLGISVNNDGSLTLRRERAGFLAERGLLRRGWILPERQQLGAVILDHAQQCWNQFIHRNSGTRSKLQQQY